MRLKPAMSEEARDPHSLLFAMLGQCGIAGLLAALCRIVFPFALVLGLWRKHHHPDHLLFMALCSGWAAWLIHAQFQFNDTIPGTSYLAAFAGFWAFRSPSDAGAAAILTGKKALILRLAALPVALFSIWPLQTLTAEKELQEVVSTPAASAAEALSRLEGIEKRLPFSPTPCRIRGDFALHSRDMDQALSANQELVRRTPHRSSSYCRLAKVQLITGRLAEAGAALQQAETWYPYNPRLFPLLGIHRLLQMPEFLALALPERLSSLDLLLNLESSLQRDNGRILVLLYPDKEASALLSPLLLNLLNQTGIQTRHQEPVIFQGN